MKRVLTLLIVGIMATLSMAATAVPGHQGRDGTVTGKYTEEMGPCTADVKYRGDFGGDPNLDDGWIINNIKCDDGSRYNYLFVHETDPRYTGNEDLEIWGDWEWHVLTASGHGNLANPHHPKYYFD